MSKAFIDCLRIPSKTKISGLLRPPIDKANLGPSEQKMTSKSACFFSCKHELSKLKCINKDLFVCQCALEIPIHLLGV